MIDPQHLAANLALGPDGLWWPRTRSRVDYPDEGNAFCFQVEDQSFWFAHRNRCVLTAVTRFKPSGALFDIGGGNGFVARGLVDAGYDAVVVEPGAVGAANARTRGLAPVICSTLDDAGFHPRGSARRRPLRRAGAHRGRSAGARSSRDLIQPGGRLYLTVPAYQTLWSGEDDLGGHHRRYTCASLSRVVAAAGFTVEFSSYFFWPLPLPILLVRALPWRLGHRPPVDIEAIRRELKPPSGLAVQALMALLGLEHRWLERGGTLPFGGSCLLVAQRR